MTDREHHRTPEEREADATERDVAAALRDKLGDQDSPGEARARREAAQDRFDAMRDRGDARRERNGS